MVWLSILAFVAFLGVLLAIPVVVDKVQDRKLQREEEKRRKRNIECITGCAKIIFDTLNAQSGDDFYKVVEVYWRRNTGIWKDMPRAFYTERNIASMLCIGRVLDAKTVKAIMATYADN